MSDSPAAPESPPPSEAFTKRGAPLIGPAGLKLGLLGLLVVALLIPQFFVADLISERENRQHQVRNEIARAWGGSQVVQGPMLVVPLRPRLGPDGKPLPPQEVAIPAAELSIAATLDPERRRRGMFEAIVYTARLDISGRFGDVAAAMPADADPDWAGARLVTGASDLRPSVGAPELRWGDRPLAAVADTARGCGPVETMSWPLGLDAAPQPGATFAGGMELRGTGSLAFLPTARRAQFTARGAWDTPSYIGADLPLRAETGADGFRAEWSAGTPAQAIRLHQGHCTNVAAAGTMGVALLEAVPTYRMVNRTAKYGVLFVLLAVMTYWLFERVSRVRIHLVQYGLLGLSLVLFPMLLLAIAETVGFGMAYAISVAMVMGQASLYTAGVTRRPRLAAVFAAVLAALFGFLYLVLRMESMALLGGALGLFALLSAVMLATRRIAARDA